MQKSQNNFARIETYEGWDDYEGSYDFYVCGVCGTWLTDSLAICFNKEKIPKYCPKCKRRLYRDWEIKNNCTIFENYSNNIHAIWIDFTCLYTFKII